MIADCGFSSPKEIIRSVFHRVVHLPAAPTLWAADLFARLFAGFSLSEKDTRKILQNSKIPVLLVHGTEDGFVPCEMSKQAIKSCNEKSCLLTVENADHGFSFLTDKPRVLKEIKEFINSSFN